MRCWAITVELGGREYEIPALPAADWWPILVEARPSAILDILMSSEDLDARILAGEIKGGDLNIALNDAIEEVTGRSFHAAFVLAMTAATAWPAIGGTLAQRGFRWDVMPIGAA